MDFTREPVVETVITPKEGHKLIIRASSGNGEEQYSVGAVEVVSFGGNCFFRFLEKPKAFLLPMNHYEVVEAREIRTVLKKPQIEKSIKIAGGRKVSPPPLPSFSEESKEGESKEEESKEELPRRKEKKRGRKSLKKESFLEKPAERESETPPPPSSQKRTLLPPPALLISDSIDRYKEYRVEQTQGKAADKQPPPHDKKEFSPPEKAHPKIIDIKDKVDASKEEEGKET